MYRLLPGFVLLAVLACYFAPKTAFADDSSSDQELHAYLLKFDRSSLTVAAGSTVTITLYNDENYVAHNLGSDVPGAVTTKACLGPCTMTLTFTAPDPGQYHFFCTLHPDTMTGDLWVQ